jgi:hypothetical protein
MSMKLKDYPSNNGHRHDDKYDIFNNNDIPL